MDNKDLERLIKQNKDSDINMKTLEKFVGKELTYDYVLTCKNRLDSTFMYLYKSYGFDNFYDMFIYCDLQKEKPNKYIQKTINKHDNNLTLYKPIVDNKVTKGLELIESYKDLKTTYKVINKYSNLNDIKDKVEKLVKKDIVGELEGDIVAEYYDTYGNKRGMTFYDTQNDSITIKGYIGDRNIKGLGVKSFKESMTIAKTEQNPIEISKDFGDNAVAFLKSLGMSERDNKLYMSV